MTTPVAQRPGATSSPEPRVVGAQARELARVRVSFDGDVPLEDPGATGDALDPARYTITRLSAPAVDASVVDVEAVTSSSVDLVTDVPLTPGASYRVDVGGDASTGEASSNATDNAAIFTGFTPSRPGNRRWDLYQLLPQINRREDVTGDLRSFVGCLQEVTDLLLADLDRFGDILDPDRAGEPVLDLMLAELGNPFAFDFALVEKQRLVNVLVQIYREKGTSVGITNAIRFLLGLEVQVTSYAGEALVLGDAQLGEDWVLGPSSAFGALAFEIVSPKILDDDERRRLREVVEYMKPAQTHFARLVEPFPPEQIDHLELGLSELGETWDLH